MKTKRTSTITAITVTLAILAAFGVFRNAQSVKAQELPPSTVTHLNVPERNVVNLVGTPTSNLREVGRDGSTSSSDYTVPAGMVLVITDITASVQSDENVLIPLSLRILLDASILRTIFRMQVRMDKYGYATTKDHFTAGLMVGPGNRLQIQGSSRSSVSASVLGYTVSISDAPQ